MKRRLTYAESGVDRKLRARAKTALRMLEQTYRFSPRMLRLPYGNVFAFGGRYLDLAIEGVGTKVLLAQLADKYDTIGIDGVAMVVNDVIRSGSKPLAVADNIHAHASDPRLVEEWLKGVVKGAAESRCVVAGGEIGDVAEVIRGLEEGRGFDMVVSCIGEADEDDIIRGNDIKPRDSVIGLRSAGVHSNGITLARKALFKLWGGRFDPHDIPDGLDRELILEVLEPTKIYVKPLLKVAQKHRIKGAVHITGDAYQKFSRLMEFSKAVGFEFNNFKPQPIFKLIQESGNISDDEMLRTFNMGWGFAIIIDPSEKDDVLDTLERGRVEADVIGEATSARWIVACYGKKRVVLW
jgi:phosphoribosylformylglycinamidine cyclo-ligase